jgi:hypothetical protein
MHPPKRSTFDVPAMINIDTKGERRTVEEYRVTDFGLYMSRAMVGRPTATWVESWLLPELGVCVTDWWWSPGHEREQDYYLDICDIVVDGGRWLLTDHYLDIVVRTGGRRWSSTSTSSWPPSRSACSTPPTPRPRCTAPTAPSTAGPATTTTWTAGWAGWGSS